MIQKITKGSGFRGAVSYLLREKDEAKERGKDQDKRQERAGKGRTKSHGSERAKSKGSETGRDGEDGEERARIIGGNMAGRNARQLASEFKLSRSLRPGVRKAVFHASLSLPKGENLSDEKWRRVANDYVKRMGFADSQHVIVRHQDKEHDHVHIVASRIGMDGRVVSESNDFQRGESIVRGLEKEHSLTPTRPSREAIRSAPTRYEIERMVKTGEPTTKMRMQHIVDQAINKPATMPQMIERLKAAGVEVKVYSHSKGEPSGISYRMDGVAMSGSDLGRGYTWNGLQKRGVSYERERDHLALNGGEQQRGERETVKTDRSGAANRDAGNRNRAAQAGERDIARGERALGDYARQSDKTEQAARGALRAAEKIRDRGRNRERDIDRGR